MAAKPTRLTHKIAI